MFAGNKSTFDREFFAREPDFELYHEFFAREADFELCHHFMFRYSDFLGLHEKLVARYQGRGRIIPPAPEKSLLGTTRVNIQSIDIVRNLRCRNCRSRWAAGRW